MTSVTVYDGLDSIGGNKIYLEENGKGVFLDFGLNFKAYNQYYKNFLSERAIRGIHDLYQLGLIPEINNYRPDLVPIDLDLSHHKKLNIEAVLLSHAHKDHYGNLGLLDDEVPVVASSQTLALLKGLLDVSTAQLGSDVIYYAKRSSEKDGRVMTINRGNFKQRTLVCSHYRPELEDFLLAKSRASREINASKLISIENYPLNFKITPFEVDHSIYGATAFLIEGDSLVAYSGDFRLHGKQAHKSQKFFSAAKEARVLIIEGTRANITEETDTERDIFHNCLEKSKEAKGLVVANFSPNNLERLETFRDVASSIGRQLVVSPKEAYLLKALEQADGIDRAKEVSVYESVRSKVPYWEKEYLKDLDKVNSGAIRKNPDAYIACFSYYALNNLLDINVRQGTYIYSSVRAYEEEAEYDFIRLYKWMRGVFNFEIIGFDVVKHKGKKIPRFAKGYHTSGHAGQKDLIKAIEMVDPDVLIPVHTENREWFANTFDMVPNIKKGKPIIV